MDTERSKSRRLLAVAWAGLVVLLLPDASGSETERAAAPAGLRCEPDQVHASGRPDPALFTPEASKGVQAHWCERYDDWGRSTRSGPYLELHSDGTLRTRARYEDSRLAGPIEVRHRNGRPFLAGRLENEVWEGPFALFHDNGGPWWVARFRGGRLHGTVRSYYRDGALESEAHFQSGREDGLARSFYPRAAGGGVKSETRIEADLPVGAHRLFSRTGELRRRLEGPQAPTPVEAGSGKRARPADLERRRRADATRRPRAETTQRRQAGPAPGPARSGSHESRRKND